MAKKKTDNDRLFAELKDVMSGFTDNFDVSQLANISDSTPKVSAEEQMKLISAFSDETKPVNIYHSDRQSITFNEEQTEKLLTALQEQADKKGFVQGMFDRKLQNQIDNVLKNLDGSELVEMQLAKTENDNLSLSFSVVAYLSLIHI